MMFPLAFGIVDSESEDNWRWFISELRKMLGVNTDEMPILTILSERNPQVVKYVSERRRLDEREQSFHPKKPSTYI
jgi:hypothetical protein